MCLLEEEQLHQVEMELMFLLQLPLLPTLRTLCPIQLSLMPRVMDLLAVPHLGGLRRGMSILFMGNASLINQ